MSSNILNELEANIPQKENLRTFEVAEILGKTKRRIEQLCLQAKFFYYDDDGDYHEGSFKSGSHWQIKRHGIIAYLERSNQ